MSEHSKSPKPYVIGLTGGIGSGKSLVAGHFVELGVAIIDTDELAHALTRPGAAAMPAIRAAFGESFLETDGALDRTAMRRHVFQDPAARLVLENILHPLIFAGAQAALALASTPYVLLAVPLLAKHHAQWQPIIDRVLLVDCSSETQIRRLTTCRGLSVAEAKQILAAQTSRAARQRIAHDTIENDSDVPSARIGLRQAVEALHCSYLQLAGSVHLHRRTD
ncbi:MAG: dephospho-CoA kinase [Burkholderiaceae bacterium]|jgi:dephospho-CoA kinase